MLVLSCIADNPVSITVSDFPCKAKFGGGFVAHDCGLIPHAPEEGDVDVEIVAMFGLDLDRVSVSALQTERDDRLWVAVYPGGNPVGPKN
jgi:hypothetical protein